MKCNLSFLETFPFLVEGGVLYPVFHQQHPEVVDI